MIELMFGFGTEKVLVIVNGNDIRFSQTNQGNQQATIDGLKLDYNGVIREHPDLEVREDWREEAIKRFKKKIDGFNSNKEIAKYIIEDLKKYGYKPVLLQEEGHRPRRIE